MLFSYHGNSIVMRQSPYDTQKFMCIIRWEGRKRKNNKIVFKQVWLNFEIILSVWKWLKIIVSIAILMSFLTNGWNVGYLLYRNKAYLK